MFATSADVLNICLAIGVIILTIFLAILLFYGILVLRDVSKSTERLNDLTEKLHKTITAPLKLVDYLVAKAEPLMETAVEKVKKKVEKKLED